MRSSKSIVTGVAVLAALALPMVAGAANKLVVNGTDGTTPQMVVTDSGFIGVGTSTPAYPLHVVGTNSSVLFSFPGRTTYNRYDTPQLLFSRNNDIANNGGLATNGDRLGFFNFGTIINSAFKQSAGIYAEADGAHTTTSYPGALMFGTTSPTGVYMAERMRITKYGYVGIGTASPAQMLEVNGGVRLNTATVKATCSSTVRGTVWFTQGGSGVADTLEVCAKDAAGVYAWKTLF